jgi:hypothetical protein
MRYDVEMADGLRGAEVFRSLCAQASMTIRELTDLVDAHGRDAAIKIAVGKVERRGRAGTWLPPAAAWSSITQTCGDRGFWRRQTHPVDGLGHVAADTREGMVDECAPPFRAGDSTSAARTPESPARLRRWAHSPR